MSTSRFQTFPHQYLRQFCIHVFKQMGCPDADAKLAADVLLLADLRGIDSHGVARLSGYIRLWEKKRINPTPDIRIVHETASTATVDGDAGLGLVVAPKAAGNCYTQGKRSRKRLGGHTQFQPFRYCGIPCHDGHSARYDRL